LKSCVFPAVRGRQISIFSINPETEIISRGLVYPLAGRKLRNWWEATLNEAAGEVVELEFENGAIIVFTCF
ncbi:MAG: thiamine diphosphokinase, partial [Bacteroidales bacterium]|nr:thiamine diphosphokinase [Bacteroidales bacterium]